MVYNFRWTITVIILLFVATNDAAAQRIAKANRILIILDASGSMNSVWQKEKKIVAAQKIISLINDSLKAKSNTEVALRVFGHQSDKALKDCNDSKLEIPFCKPDAFPVVEKFKTIKPKGYSPLALSIGKSAEDFPTGGNNTVIIITDGIENCEGNPCEIAAELQRKGVLLRSFVIGLGLTPEQIKSFECIGKTYNAQTEQISTQISKLLISSILSPTTLQVSLLTQQNKPTVTGLPMSFFDGYRNPHNIYHTLNAQNQPDTLLVSSNDGYVLKIHSIPASYSKPFDVRPRKHNTTSALVPMGALKINIVGKTKVSGLKCTIRKLDKTEIIHVQNANSTQNYLVGEYELEAFTTPRTKTIQTIGQSKVTVLNIPTPGTLAISCSTPGYISVFTKIDGENDEKVAETENMKPVFQLQPGVYTILFRGKNSYSAASTSVQNVTIVSDTPTAIKF